MNKDQQTIRVESLPAKPELTNEADVEANFIEPILKWLGWGDTRIKRKHSLKEFMCGTGTKQYSHKPDYVILDTNRMPCLIIDAKAPEEDLSKHTDQCATYCLQLNGNDEAVKYFILSNGLQTRVYDWKGKKEMLRLSYEDFCEGTEKSQSFRTLLTSLTLSQKKEGVKGKYIIFQRTTKEEAQKVFKACHKIIWKSEKIGVNAAFMEFVKLIFLKLDSDKKIHSKYEYKDGEDSMRIPEEDVLFSVSWIEANTSDMQKNPVKDMQFHNLTEELKSQIKKRKKKPLFDENETIILKATTIKSVVRKLENLDLYGIDEDLNGRLFETFLNATMRGNDLGQYFTPRSVVKLGVALAELKADKEHIDKVLDGSCGTGGFLIEAFADMRKKIYGVGNYTQYEKEGLERELTTNCIYGVDAAKSPKLARIARINMYLHGDGGSNIYMGDGLCKNLKPDETDTTEFRDEMESMQGNFNMESFDVIITNPPFSMDLKVDNEQDRAILNDYDLLYYEYPKRSLRTGIMFIERYEGLLRKGGKLITIIDNTVLNSSKYEFVRDYIREKFNIKAVVSLHGDAFRQSKARVKTSLIMLEKKMNGEAQADAFMTFSVKLGVDDMPSSTPQSLIDKARKEANDEIEKIINDYHAFQRGETGLWRVTPDRLKGRLDVKSCVPFRGRYVENWHTAGYSTKKLCELFSERKDLISPQKDFGTDVFRILTIKYDGINSVNEEKLGADIAGKGYIVNEGDMVMSRYNAYYGAIGCVSEEEQGAFASKSYIVLRPNDKIDGLYAWAVLRSTELRADLLDSAIGVGRSTIIWEEIKDVEIPYINDNEQRKKYVDRVLLSWDKIKEARMGIESVTAELGEKFNTEGPDSVFRFDANKPPR